ncbi:hypothetical protein [Candidatus Hodarchaeum mangrovi]
MEPLELLGVGFVTISIILWILLGIKLILSYRRSPKPQTLSLALVLIFGGIAMLFLATEQILLLTGADPTIGSTPIYEILSFSEIPNIFLLAFFAAALAWISSGLAIILMNFFTLSFFPDTSKKILIAPILVITLYLTIIIFSPFQFAYTGSDWSPEHDITTNFILWILFLFPLWIVTLLFFYLSISLLRQNSPTWRRLFWIFIAQTLLSIGFTVEILNPPAFTGLINDLGIQIALFLSDAFWSTSSRFLMMIYPLLMWIGVFTPNWAKGMLGVSS